MFVSEECCVLSGRVLCVGLIISPEESFRLWCLSVIVKLRECAVRGPLEAAVGPLEAVAPCENMLSASSVRNYERADICVCGFVCR